MKSVNMKKIPTIPIPTRKGICVKSLPIAGAVLLTAACLSAQTVLAASEFSDGSFSFQKSEYGTAIVSSYSLTQAEIEVPGQILGYPVTGIGDYAFFNCDSIQSVSLPPSVRSIGDFAFAGNDGLLSVTIPQYCESIAEDAFFDSPNVVLQIYYDSAARDFAEEHALHYRLLDNVMLGDSNTNGTVGIDDATAIQRHAADAEALEGIALKAADVNGDGQIDISDATVLQKYLADYDIAFPVGEAITG